MGSGRPAAWTARSSSYATQVPTLCATTCSGHACRWVRSQAASAEHVGDDCHLLISCLPLCHMQLVAAPLLHAAAVTQNTTEPTQSAHHIRCVQQAACHHRQQRCRQLAAGGDWLLAAARVAARRLHRQALGAVGTAPVLRQVAAVFSQQCWGSLLGGQYRAWMLYCRQRPNVQADASTCPAATPFYSM